MVVVELAGGYVQRRQSNCVVCHYWNFYWSSFQPADEQQHNDNPNKSTINLKRSVLLCCVWFSSSFIPVFTWWLDKNVNSTFENRDLNDKVVPIFMAVIPNFSPPQTARHPFSRICTLLFLYVTRRCWMVQQRRSRGEEKKTILSWINRSVCEQNKSNQIPEHSA